MTDARATYICYFTSMGLYPGWGSNPCSLCYMIDVQTYWLTPLLTRPARQTNRKVTYSSCNVRIKDVWNALALRMTGARATYICYFTSVSLYPGWGSNPYQSILRHRPYSQTNSPAQHSAGTGIYFISLIIYIVWDIMKHIKKNPFPLRLSVIQATESPNQYSSTHYEETKREKHHTCATKATLAGNQVQKGV